MRWVSLWRPAEFICGCVLVTILFAGLTPFHSPRNGVRWLQSGNGVQFVRYGTILSSAEFVAPSTADASATLELALVPERVPYSGTILAFSTSEHIQQFSVGQFKSNIILRAASPVSPYRTITAGIERALVALEPAFVTLTFGPRQSSIYLNGQRAGVFPDFQVARDLSGKLVIGTAPDANNNWLGRIKALALYGQELPPGRVREHYESWINQGVLPFSASECPVAIYRFNEHDGFVVHNQVPRRIDLKIPDRYLLLHQPFLKPFWDEYSPNWSHWEDVLVNIFGFVPLGVVFGGYWSSVRPVGRPALVATLFGFAVSLTIELLQSQLPTRSSGTTDLFTNTIGTFAGVQMYHCGIVRRVLTAMFRFGAKPG